MYMVMSRLLAQEIDEVRQKWFGFSLSGNLNASELSKPLNEFQFPSIPLSDSKSALDNLLIVLPQDLVTMQDVGDAEFLLTTSLSSSASMSWSTSRELLSSCALLVNIVDTLTYRLPRAIWPMINQEERARLLPSQKVLEAIPHTENMEKLCLEASKVEVCGSTWLALFDETTVRNNLSELSRLLPTHTPIKWLMLDYPNTPLASTLIQQLSTRLKTTIDTINSAGSDLSGSVRQAVVDVVREAYPHLATALNAILIKLAQARQDLITWSNSKQKLEREKELVQDYERMKLARAVSDSVQDELNRLKRFARTESDIAPQYARLLPTTLSVALQQERQKAIDALLRVFGTSLPASTASTSSQVSTFPYSSSGPSLAASISHSATTTNMRRQINRLEQEIRDLKRQNVTLAKEKALSASSIEKLNSEISKLAQSTTQNVGQTEEIERLERELQEALTALKARDEEIAAIRAETALARAKYAEEIATRDAELAKTKEALVKEMEASAQLEANLAELVAQKVESGKMESAKAEQVIAGHQQKLKDLELQLHESRAQYEAATQANLAASQAAQLATEAAHSNAQAELKALQSQLSASLAQIAASHEQIARLKEEKDLSVASLKQEADLIGQEKTSLQSQVERLTQEMERLNTQLNESMEAQLHQADKLEQLRNEQLQTENDARLARYLQEEEELSKLETLDKDTIIKLYLKQASLLAAYKQDNINFSAAHREQMQKIGLLKTMFDTLIIKSSLQESHD